MRRSRCQAFLLTLNNVPTRTGRRTPTLWSPHPNAGDIPDAGGAPGPDTRCNARRGPHASLARPSRPRAPGRCARRDRCCAGRGRDGPRRAVGDVRGRHPARRGGRPSVGAGRRDLRAALVRRLHRHAVARSQPRLRSARPEGDHPDHARRRRGHAAAPHRGRRWRGDDAVGAAALRPRHARRDHHAAHLPRARLRGVPRVDRRGRHRARRDRRRPARPDRAARRAGHRGHGRCRARRVVDAGRGHRTRPHGRRRPRRLGAGGRRSPAVG